MPTVLEYLESFNRKERFFLVGTALGSPKFRLAPSFRARLGEAFSVQVPGNAFAAMDYHLDWIHASLFLPGREDDPVHPNTPRIVSGNQEDTALLVAFEENSITHILLIEAKAETSWNNEQLKSEAVRYTKIFGTDGDKYPQVEPHFGLMSPCPPHRLKTKYWPAWMTKGDEPIWLELYVPPGRRQLTRCDQNRRPSATAGYFRVHKKTSCSNRVKGNVDIPR